MPEVDTEQMIEVDRAMIEDYGIELVQMMENAGRNLAHLARVRFLDGDPRDKAVAVLAGTGNNGGGAMVCARRLHNWRARVHVVLTKPPDALTGVSAHQFAILERLGVTIVAPSGRWVEASDPDEAGTTAELPVESPELLVDGIIGYSLSGDPRGAAASLIEAANGSPAPLLSLDAPSGFDAASGAFLEPSARAAATMTLALPKRGLRAPHAADYVGELYLADISVPPDLYRGEKLGFEVEPIFAESDIVRLS